MHFTKIAEGCFFFFGRDPLSLISTRRLACSKGKCKRQNPRNTANIFEKQMHMSKTHQNIRNAKEYTKTLIDGVAVPLQRRDKQTKKKESGETHMLFHDILNASYLQQQTKKRCACFFFKTTTAEKNSIEMKHVYPKYQRPLNC